MFSFSRVEHRYGNAVVLHIAEWEAQRGEHLLLAGPSGSGKSTALALLAGLLRPTSGTIRVANQNLAQLTGSRLDRWRGRTIGFVPQRLHLMNTLSVLDNLLLAQYLAGATADVKAARVLLESVGLAPHAHQRPDTLSQGQAQRAAVARAVVNRPALLIADEPTSSLDDENASRALALLVERAEHCDATLLVASHDGRIKNAFGRLLELPARSDSRRAA